MQEKWSPRKVSFVASSFLAEWYQTQSRETYVWQWSFSLTSVRLHAVVMTRKHKHKTSEMERHFEMYCSIFCPANVGETQNIHTYGWVDTNLQKVLSELLEYEVFNSAQLLFLVYIFVIFQCNSSASLRWTVLPMWMHFPIFGISAAYIEWAKEEFWGLLS